MLQKCVGGLDLPQTPLWRAYSTSSDPLTGSEGSTSQQGRDGKEREVKGEGERSEEDGKGGEKERREGESHSMQFCQLESSPNY